MIKQFQDRVRNTRERQINDHAYSSEVLRQQLRQPSPM